MHYLYVKINIQKNS